MSEQKIEVDIAILGGGIGGYSAAVRAAQLGQSVVIVEKDKLGGTCLHRGCIPSKSLLRSAELFVAMQESESYGIEAERVALNFTKVQERKQRMVEQLQQGVEFLMSSNKIRVLHGSGRVIGPSIFSPKSGALAVEAHDGQSYTVISNHLIIATGSRPRTIEGIEIDGETIMTSDEALEMTKLPQSMIIVGGGVIGMEWASMLNDFGVEVTVVEAAERLLVQEDKDISKYITRSLEQRGVKVHTTAQVRSHTIHNDGVTIEVEKQEDHIELTAEKMLICIGRKANVEQLGLENTDVSVENDVIKVNEHLQTTESHIYAIGDVNGGMQLAHVAAHEGEVAVLHSVGQAAQLSPHHLVPRCIYSRPEIASVGWTEQEAKAKGFDLKTATIPFSAIGKAHVYGATEGFVKVIVDRSTDDLIGIHMIGPHVTDFISEAVLAQIIDASPWEVGQAIHPHPSLSEGLSEAMAAVDLRK